MGNFSLRIIKEADFNQDGNLDRVTAQCDENQCKDYQVELKTAAGNYVEVFNRSAMAPYTPQAGDKVVLSPEYYALYTEWPASPGAPLPHAVKIFGEKRRLLSAAEIIEKCNEIGNAEDRHSCIRQASRRDNMDPHSYYPEDHIFQTKPNLEESVNAHLVFFEENDPAIPRKYLQRFSSRLINPAVYNLEAPEKPAPSAPESASPCPEDDICTQNPHLLIKKLLGIKASKLIQLKGLEQTEPSRLDQKKKPAEAMARQEKKAQSYLKILQRLPELPVETMVVLLDLLLESKRPTRSFDAATYQIAAKILEERFKNPTVLRQWVAYLDEKAAESPNFAWTWRERLDILTPVLHDSILADQSSLPWMMEQTFYDQLFRLAGRVTELKGPALVSAVTRGHKRPEMEAILQELLKSPLKKERLMAVYASPRFYQDERLFPDLLRLAKDLDEDVRFAAFQMLTHVKPSKGWAKEVRETLWRGLEDSSLKIQILNAMFWIDAKDPAIASRLYTKLKAYLTDPIYSERKVSIVPENKPLPGGLGKRSGPSFGIDPVESLAREYRIQLFQNRHKMETEIVFAQKSAKDETPLSLRLLALDAIAKFGLPELKEAEMKEAKELLAKVLKEETKNPGVILAAQALAQVMENKSVPVLMARLQEGAPDELFLFTIQKVQEFKARQEMPRVYALILHPNRDVRRFALQTMNLFDGELTLRSLLRDSAGANPAVRQKVAEGLGLISDPRSAERLLVMTKDSAEGVQEESLKALARLMKSRDEKVKKVITAALEKNPELQKKLERV
ncbi:MAG: HEAT repeat domain-containing protein [bacterium]